MFWKRRLQLGDVTWDFGTYVGNWDVVRVARSDPGR